MSELTDLEICNMILELEGWTKENRGDAAYYFKNHLSSAIVGFDVVESKALLWNLMIKYKVVICYVSNSAYIVDENADQYDGCAGTVCFELDEEIPRAVCLCILKSKGKS